VIKKTKKQTPNKQHLGFKYSLSIILQYELSELSVGTELPDARGRASLVRTALYYFQALAHAPHPLT